MARTITQLARHALAKIGLKADNWGVATNNGTGIDRLGYDYALIVFNAGTVGASGTVDVKIQDSADNSSFTDITSAAFTQITASNDEAIYLMEIDLRDYRRYIRVVGVVGTAACDFGVDVLLYHGSTHRPVSQDQTAIYVGF